MAKASDVQRILLIKPSSLGDIVHAMPVVAALKQRWPAAHLTWLVKRQWAELVERIEGVDRVWPVHASLQGWLSQVPALRREAFDLVIDLQGLLRSAVMGWASGCPVRAGFANGREGSPWFYTRRVTVPTAEMHAVDRYLLVAAAIGAKPVGQPEFRFRGTNADGNQVETLMRQNGLAADIPWIAMQVSARWKTKRWPLESFAAVADYFQRERLAQIALIGGADERREAERVKSLMHTPPVDLAGTTSIGLLPALLRQAALLITNDSGPMHVAAAVGTPVVGLFGPTSPVRTGPYGTRHVTLTHPLPCSPCFSRTCMNREPLACLKGITPEEVVQEATRLIAHRHQHGPKTWESHYGTPSGFRK
jgi:heptosyltransferase I